jgi:hypothetical protein
MKWEEGGETDETIKPRRINQKNKHSNGAKAENIFSLRVGILGRLHYCPGGD